MDNPSDVPHAVAIEGNGVEVDGKTVGKGEKSIASGRPQGRDLRRSTARSATGRAEAGMEGKLTVK